MRIWYGLKRVMIRLGNMNTSRKFKFKYAATEKEALQIIQFYKNNPNKNVADRPIVEILKAIDDKKIVYVTDENNRIVACAGCFDFLDGKYRELGGCQVLPNAQGFRLQQILLALRVVNEYIFDPPEDCFFSIIKATNKFSIFNVEKLGFTQWKPPNLLITHRNKVLNLPESKPSNKSYFTINLSRTINKMARQLVSLAKLPHIKKNGKIIEVEFNIPLIKQYINIVENIASK